MLTGDDRAKGQERLPAAHAPAHLPRTDHCPDRGARTMPDRPPRRIEDPRVLACERKFLTDGRRARPFMRYGYRTYAGTQRVTSSLRSAFLMRNSSQSLAESYACTWDHHLMVARE